MSSVQKTSLFAAVCLAAVSFVTAGPIAWDFGITARARSQYQPIVPISISNLPSKNHGAEFLLSAKPAGMYCANRDVTILDAASKNTWPVRPNCALVDIPVSFGYDQGEELLELDIYYETLETADEIIFEDLTLRSVETGQVFVQSKPAVLQFDLAIARRVVAGYSKWYHFDTPTTGSWKVPFLKIEFDNTYIPLGRVDVSTNLTSFSAPTNAFYLAQPGLRDDDCYIAETGAVVSVFYQVTQPWVSLIFDFSALYLPVGSSFTVNCLGWVVLPTNKNDSALGFFVTSAVKDEKTQLTTQFSNSWRMPGWKV